MEEKLLDEYYRKKIIKEIKADENVQRKIDSYKKMNMQNDNFFHYVKEYLESKLDAETVNEMHIFSNVNLQRRISKNEASIYKREPNRKFYQGENEIEDMDKIYKKMDIDTCMRYANEVYKYQEQCAIQVYPQDGELKSRVLLPHHYDVIPMEDNPEKAMCYIISNFNNTNRDKIRREDRHNATGYSQGDKYRDSVNQEIADYDDAELKEERYYVWSQSYNFMMNGKGEILDKENEQPIRYDLINEDGSILLDENILSPLFEYDCLPFIDVANKKDFEFWVRSGNSLYDACLMYNVILSSEFKTVEMQGAAQPYFKGDANHMPKNMRVGVDRMIFIPVDPENQVNSEFGFANPGSDLGGIREFRESYLRSFLSSRGLDNDIISGTEGNNSASSGVEKLLQMIDKFDASLEDFSLFRHTETKLCKIISAWLKSLYLVREDGDLILNEDFQVNIQDPKDIKCYVEYGKPEMIKTEKEELEIFQLENELGLTSRLHYLMENKGMSKEQAIAKIQEIDEFEGLNAQEIEDN